MSAISDLFGGGYSWLWILIVLFFFFLVFWWGFGGFGGFGGYGGYGYGFDGGYAPFY